MPDIVMYTKCLTFICITGPPAPPTNIHVAYISSCSIRVEWVWPQSPPTNDVALPDYAVFEVNMIGESDWTEIGRADVTHTTLMTRIPAHGLNTAFQMRAKCVSIATGDGSYFTVADTYLLYSQGKKEEGGGGVLQFSIIYVVGLND